jgi:hypothetical protein
MKVRLARFCAQLLNNHSHAPAYARFRQEIHHANVARVIALAVVITFAAFVLLMFLVSLGDSDLPPYDPPFPGEHLGWGIVGAAAWPLVLMAGLLGRDPPCFVSSIDVAGRNFLGITYRAWNCVQACTEILIIGRGEWRRTVPICTFGGVAPTAIGEL